MLAALADEQAPTWAKHDGTESERQVPATVTVSERHIAGLHHRRLSGAPVRRRLSEPLHYQTLATTNETPGTHTLLSDWNW